MAGRTLSGCRYRTATALSLCHRSKTRGDGVYSNQRWFLHWFFHLAPSSLNLRHQFRQSLCRKPSVYLKLQVWNRKCQNKCWAPISIWEPFRLRHKVCWVASALDNTASHLSPFWKILPFSLKGGVNGPKKYVWIQQLSILKQTSIVYFLGSKSGYWIWTIGSEKRKKGFSLICQHNITLNLGANIK